MTRAMWERRAIALLSLLAFRYIGVAQDSSAAKTSKVVFEKTCSACHTAESVASARRTRDQWQEVIDEMVSQQGAKIEEDEYRPILEYLVATYGKVNVNSAAADEIAQILGLSQQEAEALVKFRKENGKFADFDAVAKVPGVDAKKLEKRRDAIAY